MCLGSGRAAAKAAIEKVLEACKARDKKEDGVRDRAAKGELSLTRIDPDLKLLKKLGYL